MTKTPEEIIDELENEYDVLDDIQPEDYVFVITGSGRLRGISLPENLENEDEIHPTVEEIVKLLLEKNRETVPPNITLH